MTTEQKFNAAVNVIRNLPKSGPAQPSHHVMLKFYAYFKQATEGPNISSKPPFWDIVKKAKWDAWSKLGNMERENAMHLYVEEFKKIVETITSSNVKHYDKSEIDSFYASVPIDDLELLIGPKLARSRPNSPVDELLMSNNHDLDLVENSLEKKESLLKETPIMNDENIFRSNFNSLNESAYTNGSVRSEEEEDDEYFLDTIENSDQGSVKSRTIGDYKALSTNNQFSRMNGYSVRITDDSNNNNSRFYAEDPETSLQLTKVIVCLQKDLEKVVKSVNLIEQRIGQLQGKIGEQKSYSHVLTSPVISFVVLFTWPVVLQLLIFWFRRRK